MKQMRVKGNDTPVMPLFWKGGIIFNSIMKELIIKGMTLGLGAGLIVTLFDGFYMLTPNVYVPLSYPMLLFAFNTIFWTLIGGLSGFFMSVATRNKEDRKEKENFYWMLFFLVPFALVYGFMGRTFVPLYSSIISTASPPFDHHLSFVWVSLILLFLIIFKRRIITSKLSALSFIPEIATIAALFNFCSNISQLPVMYEFVSSLFFQDDQLSYADYLSMPTWPFIALYATGVLLIFGCYFFAFSRVSFLNKRPHHKLVLLCSTVVLSLAVLFSVNGKSFIGYDFSATRQEQPDKTAGGSSASVILIVLDTVRADRLSLYGSRVIANSLESIAKDSLVFENCIASSPWTTPSHASLFTGLYPSEHGSINAFSRAKAGLQSTPLGEEFLTLAEIFNDNGYNTGAVVSNAGALHKSFRLDQGFQRYDAARNIGDIYRLYSFRPIVHLFCRLSNVYSKFVKHYRTADDINKETFRELNKLIPHPFFLFINYMDAHDPYYPPRPFDGYFLDAKFTQLYRLKQDLLHYIKKTDDMSFNAYQLSQYDGEIAYLDHHLGMLFAKLKEMKIYDSSLIIITSDHGELFGEHGFHFHGTPMYEGVLRVPLIIKFPFNRSVGYQKEMITLTDIYPTILSICGLPIPDTISGKSFGQGSSPVVAEFDEYGMGEHRVFYDKDYKYMTYQRQRTPELYNLKEDPLELINQVEQLPHMALSMKEKLEEWIKTHPPQYDKDIKENPLSREVLEGLKALGYVE